jgi:hypothetical protein
MIFDTGWAAQNQKSDDGRQPLEPNSQVQIWVISIRAVSVYKSFHRGFFLGIRIGPIFSFDSGLRLTDIYLHRKRSVTTCVCEILKMEQLQQRIEGFYRVCWQLNVPRAAGTF